MNIFATLEEFHAFERVCYYTVRLEYDGQLEEDNETDKFLQKFMNREAHQEEIDSLLTIIREIGKRGAKKHYFRGESKADALPPPASTQRREQYLFADTAIRLYCIRLSSSVVVLLNGGLKTAFKAQECPNVSTHFRMANKITKAIDEMIVRKEIQIEGQTLTVEPDCLIQIQ